MLRHFKVNPTLNINETVYKQAKSLSTYFLSFHHKCFLNSIESEFDEFEPCLKSAKKRFKLSGGLNLKTLNTFYLEPTNFESRLKFKLRLKFFKFGLCFLFLQHICLLYISLCLSVCLSDYNWGTPAPICLKFWLRNSGESGECS